ncbi:MAG: DNA-directed RNA polymerase subunit omega [Nitrospirae bacterium]|jgi:DNA-directed RNA polymerase subunit omega|nr:DNA-directed RNA polymerase subunit omega [Nitrospirota bacterium]MCL5061950.1 DNA-directed RNA polymerase subunit omega [Nitrospirota bacterium]MDA8214702.1 DNA-directed RNA polymerase subunit omega [Nitrospiraceae bacterium]MDA8339447.1 DNA-directed RNA polymerase subunit omega [Nitrospiraceae bacterium]
MDIISLPVEYNKKEIESRYRLVVIAAQRARELSLGAAQKVQTKAKKVTTTALLEAISGGIEFITGEEAVVAREKADKIDYKKLIEEKRKPIEDLSELEKDLKVYLHEKGATEKALEELFAETEEGEEAEAGEE